MEELVARELPGAIGLVCKHFFGGAALYSNNTICASLTPAGIAFKLPEHRCSTLIASGKALPLRYFDKSPVKKGYVLFPDASSLAPADVASYLKECLSHANSPDA
ncbi:MAG: TfoX/Sxy family protein [Polaromonas sp.]